MMQNQNITGKEIEKLRIQSIKQINLSNLDIIQDNTDLLELEQRYENLCLPHSDKRIIDDYIACILSRQERMESLIYSAGWNDALQL